MKKTISIILSLVMALTMTMGLDFSAFAIEDGSENWEYEIINGNKARIIYYYGDDVTNLAIPSRLDGYTVTSIGENALDYESFEYVTIPSTVTEIMNYAFYGCKNLKNIVVPSSVTTLGYDVFACCESLITANLQCNISILPEETFEGCELLTTVTLPSTLTKLEAECFSGCFNLQSINLPNSITEIGDDCFYDCINLSSISLPSSLLIIREDAFWNCKALTSITFPSSLKTVERWAFRGSSILTFDFPASVSYIGGNFSDATQRIIVRNPYCELDNIFSSITICANNYSTAQTYATENYNEFIALEATTCFNRGYHNYIYVDVQPTCISYGYFGYICTDCGREKEMYKRDYYSYHNYNGGQYCTVCGSADPYYTPPQAVQPPVNVYTPPVADVYTPTAQVTVVAPKATSIKSLSKGKKSFKVTWKKVSSVSGYQVQYSTDKKLKKGCKTYTVKKGSATSATIKKLSSKKKYYVRVRTYKVVAGQKVYSSWSKVKTVTTK